MPTLQPRHEAQVGVGRARADELRHLVELGNTRARRLQDIESDTGYDTRRRAPEGALTGVSQTAVYDTC